MGVIYKITNKINGKVYIGQTIQNPLVRFRRHKAGNFAIGNAIRKYGESNFKLEVIRECRCPAELNVFERLYIKRENSMFPEGYNLMEGGSTKLSDISIEKMKKTKRASNWKPSKEQVRKATKARAIPVRCIQTGEVFESAAEAGRHYKISNSHITKQCKNKLKGLLKKMRFEYYTGGGLSHT